MVEDDPFSVSARVVGHVVDGASPDPDQLGHVACQLAKMVDVFKQQLQLILPILCALFPLLPVFVVPMLFDNLQFPLHFPFLLYCMQALLDIKFFDGRKHPS